MYLGIDAGTSAVKALLVDEDQRAVAQASRSYPVSRPEPGWSEQDPADWIAATEAAIGGLRAEAPAAVGLVILIVPLEPRHLTVALEREHMRRDPIEEPAVVADHDDAAGEVEQRFLEGAKGIDVQVVGGLVEQQQVAAAPEELGQVHAIPLAAAERSHLALLLAALEVEP